MSRHTEDVDDLLGLGFSKNDALEMANTRLINKIIKEEDEDEQYLREQGVEDEELSEIDGYSDEPSYDYDEDEESELSFEDGYRFLDEDGEELWRG